MLPTKLCETVGTIIYIGPIVYCINTLCAEFDCLGLYIRFLMFLIWYALVLWEVGRCYHTIE